MNLIKIYFRLDDLLDRPNVELANRIVNLELRLKDKSSSVKILQEELSSLRDQLLKTTKETEKILKEKLKHQKEEYESVVKRHQKFIDQLIKDKKTLNQQCEGLIGEMKSLEDKYNSNLAVAENRHKVEMQKLKEMCVAGEKIRRERWVDSKTQKIKVNIIFHRKEFPTKKFLEKIFGRKQLLWKIIFQKNYSLAK